MAIAPGIEYAGTEGLVNQTVGWDGNSNPMVRQIALCGCRYYLDGKLERRCSDHNRDALRNAFNKSGGNPQPL